MCDYPYLNINNTCIIASDYYYKSYISIQTIFLFFSSIGILLNAYFNYLFYKKENKIIMKNYLFISLLISNLLILIEFIDPFGFANNIPYIYNVLLSDISTWISLSLFFYVLILLTNTMNFYNFNRMNIFNYVFIIISFILSIVFGILQGIHITNTWRGIKLILLAIVEIFMMYILNFNIIKTIINIITDIRLLERLYIKTTIFNILLTIIISFQIFIGIESFNKPHIPQMNYNKLLLPTLQLIGNYFGTFFFYGNNNNN
jgi:hypothetical protein